MSKKMAKTVLVTGASERIGRALAVGMAEMGWAVAIHYNRAEAKAEATAELCRRAGAAKTALFQTNFLAAEPAKVTAKLADRVTAEFGSLGCLINNASAYEPRPLKNTDDVLWQSQQQINFTAPFFLAKSFAAHLPKGGEGTVINILDQRVFNLTPYFPAYSLAKSGLFAATRVLALALAPQVRVNAVAPGHILPHAGQSEEEFHKLCASVPLGRASLVEDIVAAVRFFLGAHSVTGQTIAVDGGQSLGWVTAKGGQ